MTYYDLTQPAPEDRFDELQGHINELTDYIYNLETIVLFAVRYLQHPKSRA